MEAIGKLTGGVAHDFNNLLAAIIGSLELVKRRSAEGKDVSRFLDNAMQAAQRGTTLTQRMLAFARKQQMELEPVDLPQLVRGMGDLLQRTIGSEGVAIETQFPLVLKAVQADPAQLELAVMNLVVNARDAMPGGGQVVISARRMQVKNEIGLAPGEYVCLSVADEGEGMDEKTLSKAIDPFFTTKGIGKGTGLGLSMVLGMVEQFGGKLTIRSDVGKGTTVTMWLPVANEQPKPATAATPSTPDLRTVKPMIVLAVDDDEIVLVNTAAMLVDAGHSVLQASSGAQALQILGQNTWTS
jgi:signal transduction histidine kinase